MNEKNAALMRLIHRLGIIMKTTAVCTQVRRIRLGLLSLEHALVQSTWDSENIVQNIQLCKNILKSQDLTHTDNVDTTVQEKLLEGQKQKKKRWGFDILTIS